MKGEEVLVKVFVQLANMSVVSQNLLKESIVTIATLYKNALSISDLSLCEEMMNCLLKLAVSKEENIQRKVYYCGDCQVSRNGRILSETRRCILSGASCV